MAKKMGKGRKLPSLSKGRSSGKGLKGVGKVAQRNISKRRTTQRTRSQTRVQRPLPTLGRSRTRRPVGPGPALGIPPAAPGRPAQPAAPTQAELQQQFAMQLRSLQNEFGRVDQQAELRSVYQEIGEIENKFINLPHKLDELRRRGYVHSGLLEDRFEELDETWDNEIRPRVERMLGENVSRLDVEMDQLERQVTRLNFSNSAHLPRVESAIRSASFAVNEVEENIRSLYRGIIEGLGVIDMDIARVEEMISRLEESEIELIEAEGPLMMARAEWEVDGEDEGPDGFLYLTDQRLLFEQREEVAKKKFLFITTETEKLQDLLLDLQVKEIEDVSYEAEKEGFLGMGRKHLLELVLVGTADYSRLRFELFDQTGADWAAIIKRVRSGEIDEDRAEDYVEEMIAAEEATSTLPDQCPNCFAPLPEQTRGIVQVVCEYCGSVVTADGIEPQD